jgi:hypothetical protein
MYGELVRLRDWLLLLVLTGILAVSIAVYLPTNPSVFYSIIVGLLIGILFLVVLALRPEYKQSLIEGLSRLRKKDMETGGRFNRYGRLAGFLIVINSLVFRLMVQYNLVSPLFFLSFIYIQMALGVILTVSFLGIVGKLLRYPLIALIILELAVAVTVTALFLLELMPH